MLELTAEDRMAIGDLAMEVVKVLNESGIEGEERTTLAPLVWQELRNAHSSNKQQRVHQEQMDIAKKAGIGVNQLGVQANGYYGQKL